jgi:hypothetical protein
MTGPLPRGVSSLVSPVAALPSEDEDTALMIVKLSYYYLSYRLVLY